MDDSSRIRELLGHWLSLYGLRQFAPLQLHVHSTLLAHWTLVGSFHVELVASLVQVVTAGHRNNGTGGIEKVFAAYRTVTVRSSLEALVGFSMAYGYADVASLQKCQQVS